MSIRLSWIAERRSHKLLENGRLLCLLLLGLLGWWINPARSEPPNDDLPWVEDIALRPASVVKAGETGTRRWTATAAPKLTILGGSKDQQKVVAEVVEHLNETLKQTPLNGIELLKPNNPAATLRVIFCRRSAIPSKATELGFSQEVVKLIAKEKWTSLSAARNNAQNKYEIERAVVVVSSDKADADTLKTNLLRCLCADLGLQNTSTHQPESVFYRDGDKWTTAEKLTAKDQQLIKWYYNQVPAGTESLKKLYDQHWETHKK